MALWILAFASCDGETYRVRGHRVTPASVPGSGSATEAGREGTGLLGTGATPAPATPLDVPPVAAPAGDGGEHGADEGQPTPTEVTPPSGATYRLEAKDSYFPVVAYATWKYSGVMHFNNELGSAVVLTDSVTMNQDGTLSHEIRGSGTILAGIKTLVRATGTELFSAWETVPHWTGVNALVTTEHSMTKRDGTVESKQFSIVEKNNSSPGYALMGSARDPASVTAWAGQSIGQWKETSDNQTATCNIVGTVTGRFVGNEHVQVGEALLSTAHVKTIREEKYSNCQIEGAPNLAVSKVPVTFTQDGWYAKGVGLVKLKLEQTDRPQVDITLVESSLLPQQVR